VFTWSDFLAFCLDAVSFMLWYTISYLSVIVTLSFDVYESLSVLLRCRWLTSVQRKVSFVSVWFTLSYYPQPNLKHCIILVSITLFTSYRMVSILIGSDSFAFQEDSNTIRTAIISYQIAANRHNYTHIGIKTTNYSH